MNQTLSFFYVLQLLSVIDFIHGKNQETALFFNTESNAVVNSTNWKNDDLCKNCATACTFQSTSAPQMEFNEQHSISKNAFFLQKIYTDFHYMKNITLKICQKPFELSVIYDKIEKIIEFGYEIYYEDSTTNNEKLIESDYRKYGPIKDSSIIKSESVLSKIQQSLEKKISFSDDKLDLALEGKQMRFLWIPTFKLSYNGALRHPVLVTYETSVNVLNSPNKCLNYKLGKELYNGINMKTIYQQEHLDNICEGKIVPKIDEENGKNNFAEEMVYEKDHVCITAWSLIPDRYFHYYSPKSLSCSYLTTVPVWCYFADTLLKKLDQYIDVITKTLPGKKLHITSGTYETLRLNLKNVEPFAKANTSKAQTGFMEIYLLGKKLPIPAKIYKVIEYEMPTCPENRQNCWYSIIIEIHNAPYFTSDQKGICGENKNFKCDEWGWDSIYETDQIQARYISCCEVTPEIETKLKLKTDQTKSKSIFNLRDYKIEYYEGIDKKTKSLKEMVDDVMKGKSKVEVDDTSN